MIKEQATRNLINFLSSYSLPERTELLRELYDQVNNGLLCADQNGNSKNGHILDFIESLEELVPTIYSLHSKRELIFENWKNMHNGTIKL